MALIPIVQVGAQFRVGPTDFPILAARFRNGLNSLPYLVMGRSLGDLVIGIGSTEWELFDRSR